MIGKRALILLLALSLVNNKGITDAQKKKSELENKKAGTQEMIKNLQELKSDVSAYVKQLDEELIQINEEISGLNEDIEGLEKEIADAEADIRSVEATMLKQYGDMKLRIKYMYEQGSSLFLNTFFDSKTLTEMLNKGEYVNKISVYDRMKMDEYGKTREMLEGKKTELESKKTRLESLKAEAQTKQNETEQLLAEKQQQLASYDSEIGDAKNKLTEYDKAIKEQEDTIKAIEAEIKRKEEEARKAAEAAGKAYKTVDLGDISFKWPCPSSSRITSYFGDRESPTAGASSDHKGIDIGASTGDNILAAASGEVIIAQYSSSAGNYIMINHGGGVYTVYMHASELCADVGDKVEAGQTIAKVGSTGYSTGPHLHFGIRANGDYINPLAYVSP